MYSIEQVKKGLAAYLDREFMPTFDDSPVKKVLVGTAASLAITRYANLLPVLMENKFVKALDLMDDKGNIDMDALAEAVSANIPDKGVPVDIPVLKGVITIRKDDVTKLMSYISKQR